MNHLLNVKKLMKEKQRNFWESLSFYILTHTGTPQEKRKIREEIEYNYIFEDIEIK
jgi:hypothetical protein